MSCVGCHSLSVYITKVSGTRIPRTAWGWVNKFCTVVCSDLICNCIALTSLATSGNYRKKTWKAFSTTTWRRNSRYRERIDGRSRNSTGLSRIIRVTDLPDIASLSASGLLPNVIGYYIRVRSTGPAGKESNISAMVRHKIRTNDTLVCIDCQVE